MKITALLENKTKREDMLTEHGLSLYIETGNHKILFDMGQSDLFSKNAAALGIDLAAVDIAVLSHGHYDHGGGLETFLRINHTAPIYLSRYAFEPHYHGAEKYIGLDTALKEHERLVFIDSKTVIGQGLTLYPCHEKERQRQSPLSRPKNASSGKLLPKHEPGDSGLQIMENGLLLPEDFRHEQYLLAEEENHTVLFSGCSHKGILNIEEWFRPDVLIGGFHFSKLPLDDTLKEHAQYLDSFQTEYYTCHCTGRRQSEFMKNYMGHLHDLSCGQSIQLFC